MHNRASYTCYIIKKKTINKTKMLISLKKNNKLFNTFRLSFKLFQTRKCFCPQFLKVIFFYRKLLGILRGCVRFWCVQIYTKHWKDRFPQVCVPCALTDEVTWSTWLYFCNCRLDSASRQWEAFPTTLKNVHPDFLSTSFHTHSLFSHTHTQTADWSVPCFYTLLCGAKHILIQGLGSLLQKKNNFNDLTCMKKQLILR